MDSARDIDAPGLDNASGAGAIAGDEVPPLYCGCDGAGGGASAVGVLVAALLARRRR
jgi:uncharacterized protein (TIGR03382 family)